MCDFINALEYERMEDTSVLSNFYCGIYEMDDFIHNKLQERIDRKDGLLSFSISIKEQIVALVSVKESYIEIQVENKGTFRANALEIEYLAVRKEYQRKHIGKRILDWIHSDILPSYPDVKFLSVRAYCDNDTKYSAVPFYKKCGFLVIKKTHPLADNVKMAKMLK
jgi:GNAT superfamily N-acetyltransferase